MSDVPPVKPPCGDPHESLRNSIEDAWRLARQYENGYIQKEPIEKRREWVARVVRMLNHLAGELKRVLPQESWNEIATRVGAKNLRERAERGEADKLEYPKLKREDKTNLH